MRTVAVLFVHSRYEAFRLVILLLVHRRLSVGRLGFFVDVMAFGGRLGFFFALAGGGVRAPSACAAGHRLLDYLSWVSSMPGQPLSKVKPTCVFDFDLNALSKHPDLSPIIVETISLAAHTEYEWSSVLVQLLKADPKSGMAMYESVSSAEARRDMVLSVAETSLSKPDFLLVQAVMKAVYPARKIRNEFVHHIWGNTNSLPNALLLVNPAEMASWEVGLALANKQMLKTGKVIIPPEVDMHSVMVWRLPDLQEARRIAEDALKNVSDLRFGLDMSSPGSELGDPMRQQLLSHHDVLRCAKKLFQNNNLPLPRFRRRKTPSKKQ